MLEALFSRLRCRLRSLAAITLAVCLSMATLAVAPASAETRTLKLYNTHTHERVSITFKKNGRYLSSGLRELNRFLRDWRRNEITKMDPKLFDLVWEVYQKAGTSKPIHVVSGYRSPATNNMLRRRSRGVAKTSQHTRGRAMDFFIPGVNVSKLRALGLRKEVGGVGYYPTSRTPFVHMDTGSVRHWPRMTRRQLAKVFPRGDTIHVPTDGKKMPRYAEALARKKSGSSRATVVASAAPQPVRRNSSDISAEDTRRISRPPTTDTSSSPGLIARIFSSDEEEETSSASAPTPPAPLRSRLVQADTPPPVPPQAPPGVRTPDAEEPSAPSATDPVVVAEVVPRGKPAGFAAIVAAATAGSVAPGTLDAQAQRIASGLPAVEQTPPANADQPVQVASAAPTITPRPKTAELRQGPTAEGIVPRPAPSDGASAIAAVTGGIQPARKPQAELTAATLAYAPAVTASAGGGTTAAVALPKRRSAADVKSASAPSGSMSGQLPAPVIKDPLAVFAALPDRSMPALISGAATTRTRTFASLSHPNQRRLELLLSPSGRVFANRFDTGAGSAPRADRFDDGPAVVLLPVVALR
ncbi:DUF882 domain-containing protein [Stappia stellulata]|uniref:DUF882 domain-containing protein n=1 Tax=Stappia stellulata TaxID=71235 RepID=UPI001CD1C744|nr:DUF882 domain-containing protein [Stappia stellulata]MCA1243699.1 DUF882 domain-containing protein [Stappia stellulata]